MEQLMIADNQQERFCELSWLGGIIDGEGSFGFAKRKQYTPVPRIRITNTNQLMINKVIEILDIHGIKYYIESRKGKKRRKNSWTISIVGKISVQPFLRLIKPYLFSPQKMTQLKLILDFCKTKNLDNIKKVSELNFRGTKYPQRLHA